MAFLGKEYKLVRQENYEAFLRATSVPEEYIPQLLTAKTVSKFEKDGDTYTHTSTSLSGAPKVTKFKSGEEIDQTIGGKIPSKAKYIVDGNVITQTVTTDKGVATFKREFNGDELVLTLTAAAFDGVAKRYYKA